MNIKEKISAFIATLDEPKRIEIQQLHNHILQVLPETRLWLFDGKNDDGKTIANPTIGYGEYTITYANGSSKAFFQIGIGANTAGLFVHFLPMKDKQYLTQAYEETIGKAKIGGYFINFKTMKDINLDALITAIKKEAANQ